MNYLLMIYTSEAEYESLTEQEKDTLMASYLAFNDKMQQRGVLKDGERLRPVNTTTTVRVREGETLTTDGPYAETKEQLGGYFLVDCTDLDEAIAIAAQIPGAHQGAVEVRPVWSC